MKFTRLASGLLAVALSFALAGAAEASPRISPEALLTLTVTTMDGATKTAHLRCRPTGGTHQNPRRACAELRAVQGDFDGLAVLNGPMACTMEYMPVTAAAAGIWRGQPVMWEREFSNRCAMHVATGTVFVF